MIHKLAEFIALHWRSICAVVAVVLALCALAGRYIAFVLSAVNLEEGGIDESQN